MRHRLAQIHHINISILRIPDPYCYPPTARFNIMPAYTNTINDKPEAKPNQLNRQREQLDQSTSLLDSSKPQD